MGLALIYAILLGISSVKLHRAYSALEKDNRPLKPEDIIPAALPDTENAALLYESAWLRLKAEPMGQTDLLSHVADLAEEYNQGDPNSATRERLERLLETDAVRSVLQTIELGLQRPGCRFDINYEGGTSMVLTHLSPMRNLARILAARAHIQAQKGNAQDAWQTITGLLRFADALRTEPTLVSQLVRMAIVGLATETVYHLPNMTLPDESQMAVINDLLISFEDNAPVVLAFDGERILVGEPIFAQGNKAQEQLEGEIGSDSPVSSAVIGAYRLCKPLIQTDHAQYLRIIHEYARMGEQPSHASDRETADQMFRNMPKHLIISYVLAPAGDRVYHLHKRMIARLRIMHVGMVLLRHRQDQGAFPKNLSALNARIPPDPFGKKPLIYRTEGNGFLIYSVSSDEEDNEGIPRQPNIERWDIPWRFEGKATDAQ